MKYGLRKLNKDGIHHNFQWPMEVGTTVECPDWDKTPKCGGGLHFLPEAHGDWTLLLGHYWCVIEYDDELAVDIDGQKSKVPNCKIVYLSESPTEIRKFFPDWSPRNSEEAYYWALNIGDREEMKQHITEAEWAYYWARGIGDREEMKQHITEAEWAYCWARDIDGMES